jgi:hypothetical protein
MRNGDSLIVKTALRDWLNPVPREPCAMRLSKTHGDQETSSTWRDAAGADRGTPSGTQIHDLRGRKNCSVRVSS